MEFGVLDQADALCRVRRSRGDEHTEVETRLPLNSDANTLESTLFAGREGARKCRITKSGAFGRAISCSRQTPNLHKSVDGA